MRPSFLEGVPERPCGLRRLTLRPVGTAFGVLLASRPSSVFRRSSADITPGAGNRRKTELGRLANRTPKAVPTGRKVSLLKPQGRSGTPSKKLGRTGVNR